MSQLPIFKSDDRVSMQMQSRWSSQLNPVLSNALLQGVLLTGVVLKSGTTVVNTTLGRTCRGWFITDINGSATVFRPSTAPLNDITLTLTSSALVTVSLWVF
jgi:hypothetical protein